MQYKDEHKRIAAITLNRTVHEHTNDEGAGALTWMCSLPAVTLLQLSSDSPQARTAEDCSSRPQRISAASTPICNATSAIHSRRGWRVTRSSQAHHTFVVGLSSTWADGLVAAWEAAHVHTRSCTVCAEVGARLCKFMIANRGCIHRKSLKNSASTGGEVVA
jgi:hypothetical protein